VTSFLTWRRTSFTIVLKRAREIDGNTQRKSSSINHRSTSFFAPRSCVVAFDAAGETAASLVALSVMPDSCENEAIMNIKHAVKIVYDSRLVHAACTH